MNEECLICKAPLTYLEKDELMECALCHKKEMTKTRCEKVIMSAMIATQKEWIPFCPFVLRKNQKIRWR